MIRWSTLLFAWLALTPVASADVAVQESAPEQGPQAEPGPEAEPASEAAPTAEPEPTPDPAPEVVTLHVQARLPRLYFSVDGVEAGRAPRPVELAPGPHVITVAADDCHEDLKRLVMLVAGTDERLLLDPVPITGALRVIALDRDDQEVEAEVVADGKLLGPTPGPFSVPVCARHLEVGTASGGYWEGRVRFGDPEAPAAVQAHVAIGAGDPHHDPPEWTTSGQHALGTRAASGRLERPELASLKRIPRGHPHFRSAWALLLVDAEARDDRAQVCAAAEAVSSHPVYRFDPEFALALAHCNVERGDEQGVISAAGLVLSGLAERPEGARWRVERAALRLRAEAATRMARNPEEGVPSWRVDQRFERASKLWSEYREAARRVEDTPSIQEAERQLAALEARE